MIKIIIEDIAMIVNETRNPTNGLLSFSLYAKSENLNIDVKMPHPYMIINIFLIFKK